MTGNIYLDLTNQFNEGGLRAILSEGLAVVVHGLALSSKDGDWIVRETPEDLDRILRVLEGHGARYRLGAPLDVRWMSGGWSAHFEFAHEGNRVRCDFVTRPPRISAADLAAMWAEHERGEGIEEPVPTLDLRRLAELKKTDRDRDYSFIGQIARRLPRAEQVLLSRSARDLIALWPQFSAHEQEHLGAQRPLLREIGSGRRALETALDGERRELMELNEHRLAAYQRTALPWSQSWSSIKSQMATLPLLQGHALLVEVAEQILQQKNPNEQRVA